jgi:hypothetical protein
MKNSINLVKKGIFKIWKKETNISRIKKKAIVISTEFSIVNNINNEYRINNVML